MFKTEFVENDEVLTRFYEIEFEVDGIKYVNPLRSGIGATNANNARVMFELLPDHDCERHFPNNCHW